MRVLVAVKQVMDYAAAIKIHADQKSIDTSNAKMTLNPFDEIALEAAVRLKEKGLVKEIIAVSIGNLSCEDVLRTALARGADRAILISTALSDLQPLTIAKILRHISLEEQPELILLGKQAIDSDDNQVGQMLAGLLNWPQGTYASKIALKEKTLTVTREIDGGMMTIQMQLPAVVTTDLRLNEPRYISLPNIMQAKRKLITKIELSQLPIDLTQRLTIKQIALPPKRQSGIKVASVQELIMRLKTEAKVL
jgi:electron transfer flavoprotein beta subunit